MHMKQNFKTYDLNLTASMVAMGHTLDEVKKEPGGRSQFVFQKNKSLQKDITEYWKQELRLNPHALFDSLKYIKSRLYSDLG